MLLAEYDIHFLFVLRHFSFPEHFVRLIHSYYDHLSVIVDIPGLFTTRSFHFALGVFQGCTLSPVLFNIIIQLALDVLEKHQSFCYTFSCDPATKKHLCYPRPMLMISNWSQDSLSRINVCWTLSRSSFSGPALWKPVQTSAGGGIKNLCRWLPSFRSTTHHLGGAS